jgi:dTDP-L-rhamnose 4-epimerase|tara:strand:- start:3375 stop:4298 length:924 start_codon:yes stop_codon:yes gene_type:complete
LRILITGGAGFIGTKIIEKVGEKNDIIILDNFLDQVHDSREGVSFFSNVKVIVGDVRNIDDWKTALSFDPEIIIHLAAETGTSQSMDEIGRHTSTNIQGTSIMLDLINSKEFNVRKIILSSSRAVYGEGKNNEENIILQPLSVYGVTKLVQEKLIQLTCEVPYTIFRYQNVYGPGQSMNNPYTGIITIFSNLLMKNEDINIYDNGIPTRDFVYIDDVVDATLLAINSPITDGKIYNVGTSTPTSILEVAEILKNKINSQGNFNISDYHRPGDIMHAYAKIDKIGNDLSWRPLITLDEGLTRFVRSVI